MDRDAPPQLSLTPSPPIPHPPHSMFLAAGHDVAAPDPPPVGTPLLQIPPPVGTPPVPASSGSPLSSRAATKKAAPRPVSLPEPRRRPGFRSVLDSAKGRRPPSGVGIPSPIPSSAGEELPVPNPIRAAASLMWDRRIRPWHGDLGIQVRHPGRSLLPNTGPPHHPPCYPPPPPPTSSMAATASLFGGGSSPGWRPLPLLLHLRRDVRGSGCPCDPVCHSFVFTFFLFVRILLVAKLQNCYVY
jgi:hypothetical protein